MIEKFLRARIDSGVVEHGGICATKLMGRELLDHLLLWIRAAPAAATGLEIQIAGIDDIFMCRCLSSRKYLLNALELASDISQAGKCAE